MKSILSTYIQYVTSIILVLLASWPNFAIADDWPQILGPKRNGSANNEKLLEKWPKDGPKRLWKKECGQGFAGVAVKNNKVILYHRIKTNDIVECLEATNGKPIWKKEFRSKYRGGFSSDLGPRCVPLISGDDVYCFGAAGTIRCLSFDDGTQTWSKDLFEEFDANEGYFGAGSSPIIVDKTLIVIVGGKKGGIVGMDLDGKVKWKTEPDTASYSAPIALTFKFKSCVACVSKFNLKIVEVATGKVLLEQEFGKRGPTVNAAMPLKWNDKLFVSAAYNIGARMISLSDQKAIWENDDSMSSQYTTCVEHINHLFGCNGREDFSNGSLRCVRAKDGKVLWDEPSPGICHLIKVRDKAIVWSIDGSLRLIRLNLEKYELLQETQIFSKNSKSLPALSNGRLFVKSNGDAGPGKLVCLQVGK